MVITWRANRPPACDGHGSLAEAPLPYLDAATLMLEHLRDYHGKNVGKALDQLLDRRTVGEVA
jgi:hypothetical protein